MHYGSYHPELIWLSKLMAYLENIAADYSLMS